MPLGQNEVYERVNFDQENNKMPPPLSTALKVDSNLQLSRMNFKQSLTALSSTCTLSNIEKLDLPAYPSPYELAQLSLKVYMMKRTGESDRDYEERMQLPSGWKLLTAACNTHLRNGYYGAAFWNCERRQVVIAHRGTHNIGTVWAQLQGMMFKKYSSCMNSAITFAERVSSVLGEVSGPPFQLSFTGHSFGGWLAQITTFSTKYLKKQGSCFVKNTDTGGFHSHTAVFDCPGCHDMLLAIKRDVDVRYDSSMHLKRLDITTYLSAPNRINTYNSHLGTVYRIFTDLSDMEAVHKYTMAYNVATHSMSKIALAFDKETHEVARDSNGKLKALKVLDWPLLSLASLAGGEEYKHFFKWANHFNEYHPNAQDREMSSSIPYQTKELQETSCPFSIFSEDELMLLERWRAMKETNMTLEKLQKFTEKHNLGECNLLLPDFEMDYNKNEIHCAEKKSLIMLINRSKQLIRWFPVEFTKIMKDQFTIIPSVVKPMHKVEAKIFKDSMIKCEENFTVNIGLGEFLKSYTERVLFVTTPNIELEMLRLRNMSQQIRTTKHVPDLSREQYGNCGLIFLSWQEILRLKKSENILSIMEPRNTEDNFLILTFPMQFELNLENKQLLDELISHAHKKHCKKIIIVSSRQSSVENYFNSLQPIFKDTIKRIKNGIITWHDVTENLQKKLIAKPIISLQSQELSLGKCSETENTEIKNNVIDRLDRYVDSIVLKNPIVENILVLKLENDFFELFDCDASYITISQQVSVYQAVDFILNGESISQRMSNISAEVSKQFLFMISGVCKDDLTKVLRVTDERKADLIKGTLDRKIFLNIHQRKKVLKFKQLCHRFPEHRIYWLDLRKGIATWKLVYDSDFHTDRQFNDQIVLVKPFKQLFMQDKLYDFFILSNTAKVDLAKIFQISNEEPKTILECKHLLTVIEEETSSAYEVIRRNDRRVDLNNEED